MPVTPTDFLQYFLFHVIDGSLLCIDLFFDVQVLCSFLACVLDHNNSAAVKRVVVRDNCDFRSLYAIKLLDSLCRMHITTANSKLWLGDLQKLTSVYLPGCSVKLTTVLVYLFALKINYADIVFRGRNMFLIKSINIHF